MIPKFLAALPRNSSAPMTKEAFIILERELAANGFAIVLFN